MQAPFSQCTTYVATNAFNERSWKYIEAKYWVSCLSFDVWRAWIRAIKTALNSSFCAVTADSKSRWPHGKKRISTVSSASAQEDHDVWLLQRFLSDPDSVAVCILSGFCTFFKNFQNSCAFFQYEPTWVTWIDHVVWTRHVAHNTKWRSAWMNVHSCLAAFLSHPFRPYGFNTKSDILSWPAVGKVPRREETEKAVSKRHSIHLLQLCRFIHSLTLTLWLPSSKSTFSQLS